VVERRNPFSAWAQPSPATAVSNLEKRAEMAARALEQAQRDLAAARQRVPDDDDDDDRKKERLAKWEREGTLAERERIKAILTAPIAARQPRLAEAYAFKSDDSAAKAIAFMEAADRADAAGSAKATADRVIIAGKKARGELPCDVSAGPQVFVKFSAEEILAAARKRDGK
jgi:hypothetical protein